MTNRKKTQCRAIAPKARGNNSNEIPFQPDPGRGELSDRLRDACQEKFSTNEKLPFLTEISRHKLTVVADFNFHGIGERERIRLHNSSDLGITFVIGRALIARRHVRRAALSLA